MTEEKALTEEVAGPARTGLPVVTVVLVAAVLLVGGFIAGVQVGKRGSTDGAGAGAGPSGSAQRYGGPGRLPDGPPGSVTAGSAAVLGTVTAVNGGTITVQSQDGSTTTITTTSATNVTVTKAGTVADLRPGSPIVVQGQSAADGTVAATDIRVGAQPGPTS